MLDASAFPHILAAILDAAPPETYPALRATCRALHARFSAALFGHIVLHRAWRVVDDDEYGEALEKVIEARTPFRARIPGIIVSRAETKEGWLAEGGMYWARIVENTRVIDNSQLLRCKELINEIENDLTLRTHNTKRTAGCLCHRAAGTTVVHFRDVLPHPGENEEDTALTLPIGSLCAHSKTAPFRRIVLSLRIDTRYPNMGFADLRVPAWRWARGNRYRARDEVVLIFTPAHLMRGKARRRLDRPQGWFGLLYSFMHWYAKNGQEGNVVLVGLEVLDPAWLGQTLPRGMSLAERLKYIKEEILGHWINSKTWPSVSAKEAAADKMAAQLFVVSHAGYCERVGRAAYDLHTVPPAQHPAQGYDGLPDYPVREWNEEGARMVYWSISDDIDTDAEYAR